MSPTARAVLLGAASAVVLVGALVALVVTGTVQLPSMGGDAPSRVLVVATVPQDDALSAQYAFVLAADSTSAQLLDTDEPVVVSGTSAETAAEAYPFVGGAGVARALAKQTGGETLEWVVVPPEAWAAIVDDAGGLMVELPVGISVYREGGLEVLEAGESRLGGAQVVALASATSFIESDSAREDVEAQLAAGISSLLASAPEGLVELVDSGTADSSLEADELAGVVGR